MSWRECLHESVTHCGDRFQLFRDNDTRTYRLFGTQKESSYGTVDMTPEEMAAIGRVLLDAAEHHEDWPSEDAAQ